MPIAEHVKWLADVGSMANAAVTPAAGASAPAAAIVPAIPKGLAIVLVAILLIAKFAKGFLANISVLRGIVIGGVVATAAGMMTFEKVGKAGWFDLVLPFEIALPVFDPILILTMSLVMIVTQPALGWPVPFSQVLCSSPATPTPAGLHRRCMRDVSNTFFGRGRGRPWSEQEWAERKGRPRSRLREQRKALTGRKHHN